MLFCHQCNQLVPVSSKTAGNESNTFYCSRCGSVIPIRSGLLSGENIGGFIIDHEIGRGAMGIVYQAKQSNLERAVAIKILSEESASDEVYVERFFREARSAASLSHPNIVQAYDAGVTGNGVYYFVMELIHGDNLDRILANTGRITPSKAIPIFLSISNALDYAWTKNMLSHGDIKPENIIMQPDGKVKLADFGLARRMKDPEIPDEDIRATPAYAAPEIIQDRKDIPGFKSDMYSFGASMYHILTGQEPFPGTDPMAVCDMQIHKVQVPARRIVPEIPAELSDLVDKLMQKDPSSRPASWSDVTDQLSEILLHRHQTEKDMNDFLSENRSPKSKRKSLLPIALVSAIALIAAVSAAFLFLGDSKQDSKGNAEEIPVATVRDASFFKAQWSLLKSKYPDSDIPIRQLTDFIDEAGTLAPEAAKNMLARLQSEEIRAENEKKRLANSRAEESEFLKKRNAFLDEADTFLSANAARRDKLIGERDAAKLAEDIISRLNDLIASIPISEKLLLQQEHLDKIRSYAKAVRQIADAREIAPAPEDDATATKRSTVPVINTTKSEQAASAAGSRTSVAQNTAAARADNAAWKNYLATLPSLIGTATAIQQERTASVKKLNEILVLPNLSADFRTTGNSLLKFLNEAQTNLLTLISSNQKTLKGQVLFRYTNQDCVLDEISGQSVKMTYHDMDTGAKIPQTRTWTQLKRDEREDRIVRTIMQLPVFTKLPESFREIIFAKVFLSGTMNADSLKKFYQKSSGLPKETLDRLFLLVDLFEIPVEEEEPEVEVIEEMTEPEIENTVAESSSLNRNARARREQRRLQREERSSSGNDASGRTARTITIDPDTVINLNDVIDMLDDVPEETRSNVRQAIRRQINSGS